MTIGLTLAGLLVMVTAVHEAGHWLAVVAKRGRVLRIQIGRGLSLWRTDWNGTRVVVGLLPVGGRIEYDRVPQGTPQMVVAISGSVANLAVAYALFAISLGILATEPLTNASDGALGPLSLAVESVSAWFWLIPRTIGEIVGTGTAVELQRSVSGALALVGQWDAGSLVYVGGATSAVWAALNLIPIPVLGTDGWMVLRTLWHMLVRRAVG